MVVYVCQDRDIECGDNPANWCGHCPKRPKPRGPALSPETLRAAVTRIKALAAHRTPPYDLPADSFIEAAAADILRLGSKYPGPGALGSISIESGIEGLTLRNGDGLRLDVATNTVHVFRDDDAPALLRGHIPARVTWSPASGSAGMPVAYRYKLCGAGGTLLTAKNPAQGEQNKHGIYDNGVYDIEPLVLAHASQN